MSLASIKAHSGVQHGGKPEGRHTQLLKIIQVLTDTVQVAPVSQRRLTAVLLIRAHTLYLWVMPGTLRKTVGHQHIEHIRIGEAHTLVASFLPLSQGIVYFLLVKLQCHGSRLCSLQVEV